MFSECKHPLPATVMIKHTCTLPSRKNKTRNKPAICVFKNERRRAIDAPIRYLSPRESNARAHAHDAVSHASSLTTKNHCTELAAQLRGYFSILSINANPRKAVQITPPKRQRRKDNEKSRATRARGYTSADKSYITCAARAPAIYTVTV